MFTYRKQLERGEIDCPTYELVCALNLVEMVKAGVYDYRHPETPGAAVKDFRALDWAARKKMRDKNEAKFQALVAASVQVADDEIYADLDNKLSEETIINAGEWLAAWGGHEAGQRVLRAGVVSLRQARMRDMAKRNQPAGGGG
jgi:hypothetical protein